MAMSKTASYWDEKPTEKRPQRAKGTSLLVFVSSILVYVSIFHAFNLSPSTLLNNNKFWFFISNTLILIIAADYGAFSSSNHNKHDFYEEYVMRSQARSSPSFVPQYPESSVKKSPTKEEVEQSFDQEKMENTTTNGDPQEKVLEVVVWSEPEKTVDKKKRKFERSKSEKPSRVVVDESKNIVRRSTSVREKDIDGEQETEAVEDNEFSNMSDEELNRRVEEFIQNFNRQIRLQRAANFR